MTPAAEPTGGRNGPQTGAQRVLDLLAGVEPETYRMTPAERRAVWAALNLKGAP